VTAPLANGAQDSGMLSIPALLMTAGWVVLVVVILVLFGRTSGGAWSIAGTVARGVRDWAGTRSDASRPASPSSDSPASPSPTAAVQDL
jgi:hypothetical protein